MQQQRFDFNDCTKLFEPERCSSCSKAHRFACRPGPAWPWKGEMNSWVAEMKGAQKWDKAYNWLPSCSGMARACAQARVGLFSLHVQLSWLYLNMLAQILHGAAHAMVQCRAYRVLRCWHKMSNPPLAYMWCASGWYSSCSQYGVRSSCIAWACNALMSCQKCRSDILDVYE